MIEEVRQAISTVVTAWAQSAHAPTTYAVGTATIETFLKRQNVAVTIGESHTSPHMERDGLALIKIMGESIVGIGLEILRITDTQRLVGAIVASLLASEMR